MAWLSVRDAAPSIVGPETRRSVNAHDGGGQSLGLHATRLWPLASASATAFFLTTIENLRIIFNGCLPLCIAEPRLRGGVVGGDFFLSVQCCLFPMFADVAHHA